MVVRFSSIAPEVRDDLVGLHTLMLQTLLKCLLWLTELYGTLDEDLFKRRKTERGGVKKKV